MLGIDLLFEIIVIGWVMNIAFMTFTFMWVLPQMLSFDKVRIATLVLEVETVQNLRKSVYPKWLMFIKKIAFAIPFYGAYLHFVNYLFTWTNKNTLTENILIHERNQVEAYKAKHSK